MRNLSSVKVFVQNFCTLFPISSPFPRGAWRTKIGSSFKFDVKYARNALMNLQTDILRDKNE